MKEELIDQLIEHYEENYGFEINDANDLFEDQRNLLKFLVKAGREMENWFFKKLGTGYKEKFIKKKE